MNQLNLLKQGVLSDKNRLAVKQKAKESEQKMKDILSTLFTTGLTVASGGAGLPALLQKIPAVAKAAEAGGTLGKIFKFLDATKKTTRASVYGTNILNKMIHRGIGDLLIPDTIKDYEKKAKGYLGDVGTETAAWAKSFLPNATHPWQSEKWEDVISGVSNPDNITIPYAPGQGPNQPSSYSGPLASDPRAKIPIPSQGGQMFATTPNTRGGLFGSTITQKPSGYTGGNPYYNLVNMIKD